MHILSDSQKRAKLQAQLLQAIQTGVLQDDDTRAVVGMADAEFAQSATHEEALTRWVQSWLKQHRIVFVGCEVEVAQEVMRLAKQAYGLIPLQFDVFEAMKDERDEAVQTEVLRQLESDLMTRKTKGVEPKTSAKSRRKVDLLAVPTESGPMRVPTLPKVTPQPTSTAKQLALF
jgi:hypothetical protein